MQERRPTRPGGTPADAEQRSCARPGGYGDPEVQRALRVWENPAASRTELEWAARVLLEAGVPAFFLHFGVL